MTWQVLGRNCRFLQGPETEKRKVMEIRDAIREDRCCQVSRVLQQPAAPNQQQTVLQESMSCSSINRALA